eukprot:7713638-Lingulodinium_polyedra.AAC.1
MRIAEWRFGGEPVLEFGRSVLRVVRRFGAQSFRRSPVWQGHFHFRVRHRQGATQAFAEGWPGDG